MKWNLICLVLLAALLTCSSVVAGGYANKKVFQVSEMVTMTEMIPQGAAWLTRSRNRIEGRVMVNVETPGEPYTVWWIVFNNPKACSASPCLPEDIPKPKTQAAIYHASGAISAANGLGGGVINLTFKTVGGMRPEGVFVLDWFDGTKLKDRLFRGNGLRAEVHLVVDKHPELNSWAEELSTTNWGNSNHRVAVFVAP